VFIAGRAEPGSRRTRKRLARYRTGCEGRISHLRGDVLTGTWVLLALLFG
jgi:hypothetical protein